MYHLVYEAVWNLVQQLFRRVITWRDPITIQSLPDEILEEIFFFGNELFSCEKCRKNPVRMKTGDCNCIYPFRALISKVCRRWRAVAFDSSRLWTTVNVGQKTTPDMLSEHLRRSGIRPLNIWIFIPDNYCDEQPPSSDFLPPMHLLLAEHGRWHQLHIILPFSDWMSTILSMLTHLQVPKLEVLDIDYSGPSYHPIKAARLFLNASPRLRYTRFNCCGSLLALDHALSDLRSFSIDCRLFCFSTLHRLAVVAPNLTKLELLEYERDTWNDQSSIHFPALRTLWIRSTFGNMLLLRILDAPSLESLRVENLIVTNDAADVHLNAITALDRGQGRFPLLRRLFLEVINKIAGDNFTLIMGDHLRRLLQLFPTIVHLGFAGTHVTQFLRNFATLQANPESLQLLPHLETVSMLGPDDVDFLDAVIALVSARKADGVPLSIVYVSYKVFYAWGNISRKVLRMCKLAHMGIVLRPIDPTDGMESELWTQPGWNRRGGFSGVFDTVW